MKTKVKNQKDIQSEFKELIAGITEIIVEKAIKEDMTLAVKAVEESKYNLKDAIRDFESVNQQLANIISDNKQLNDQMTDDFEKCMDKELNKLNDFVSMHLRTEEATAKEFVHTMDQSVEKLKDLFGLIEVSKNENKNISSNIEKVLNGKLTQWDASMNQKIAMNEKVSTNALESVEILDKVSKGSKAVLLDISKGVDELVAIRDNIIDYIASDTAKFQQSTDEKLDTVSLLIADTMNERFERVDENISDIIHHEKDNKADINKLSEKLVINLEKNKNTIKEEAEKHVEELKELIISSKQELEVLEKKSMAANINENKKNTEKQLKENSKVQELQLLNNNQAINSVKEDLKNSNTGIMDEIGNMSNTLTGKYEEIKYELESIYNNLEKGADEVKSLNNQMETTNNTIENKFNENMLFNQGQQVLIGEVSELLEEVRESQKRNKGLIIGILSLLGVNSVLIGGIIYLLFRW